MTFATHKFSSEQYHLMAIAGIFAPETRLELIKGEIIQMPPIGRKHAACVAKLQYLLHQNFASKSIIWTQNSIILGDSSEPQPDLALLKLRDDFYIEGLPIAEDILLIIEVADSTINYDRDIKIPLYAEFGISEAWLIDVNNKTLTRYTNPNPRGYKNTESLDQNDTISVLGIEIAVKNILG